MWRIWRLIFQRECALAWNNKADVVLPLLFFVLVVSLFPLAITPDPTLLAVIAPGLIWVTALLAMLMGMTRLLVRDFHDGCIQQWRLVPQPLSVFLQAKLTAHWCLTVLPLVVLSPLLGYALNLSGHTLLTLTLSLLLGTPVLILLAGMGAALTVSLQQQSLLLTLVFLPLSIPILIFGAGSVVAQQIGLPHSAQFALLGALLALSLPLAPWVMAQILKWLE